MTAPTPPDAPSFSAYENRYPNGESYWTVEDPRRGVFALSVSGRLSVYDSHAAAAKRCASLNGAVMPAKASRPVPRMRARAVIRPANRRDDDDIELFEEI